MTRFTLLLIVLLTGQAAADWDWYAGDIFLYSPRNTTSVIPERVQQGIDAGLDWMAMSGYAREGFFIGLRDIIQEYDLNAPRITPLLGTGWGKNQENTLMLLGVDPRAPIPRDSLYQAVAWAESHGGISILPALAAPLEPPPSRWRTPTAFLGIVNGRWHPACEPGGAWDELLIEGHRIVLLGGGDSRDSPGPGQRQKTYVWAENNHPEAIISGIRRGAVYVAQSDGIRLDFQVESSPMGGTVSITQDPYIRMKAAARSPISRVLLVADGDIVWTAHPDTTIWEERFFLPLANRTYVRAILESESGGFRTLSNPVFLISEAGRTEGELPVAERLILESEAIYVDGALEIAAGLPPESRRRILGEFLRDIRTRFASVRALENREDLISDQDLWDLMQTPDRDVRLGAAYALVARAPLELPDLLLHLMGDEDPRVREYVARMLLQYTEGADNRQLLELLNDTSPQVRIYLIRALNPAHYDSLLTRYLIVTARSPHPGIAAAATDKLVEMGSRNYKVIDALLDSARAGNPRTVEPIAWIGDRRAIAELKNIYLQAPYGPLKRASFLALEKMGAPHFDRKEVRCPWISPPPRIDGFPTEPQWQKAAQLRQFAEDTQGVPAGRTILSHIARDSARLYLAVRIEEPDTLVSNAQIRYRDERGIRNDARVEWAFSTTPGAGGPSVFSVTTLGVLLDRKGPDRSWNPSWEAVMVRQPDGWMLECALPLSILGIPQVGEIPPVRFNLSYIDGRSPAGRWTWSVTYGDPDNPARFGDLSFQAPPAGTTRDLE